MRLSCLVSRQRPFNRYFVGLVLVVGVFIIYYLLFISRSTTCCHRFYAKYAKKSVMLGGGSGEVEAKSRHAFTFNYET